GATPRPRAREVYRRLITPRTQGRRIKPQAHDQIVKDGGGSPLFRIRQQSNSVAFILPMDRVDAEVMESVRQMMVSILEESGHRANVPCVRPTRVLRMQEQACEQTRPAEG